MGGLVEDKDGGGSVHADESGEYGVSGEVDVGWEVGIRGSGGLGEAWSSRARYRVARVCTRVARFFVVDVTSCNGNLQGCVRMGEKEEEDERRGEEKKREDEEKKGHTIRPMVVVVTCSLALWTMLGVAIAAERPFVFHWCITGLPK